MLHSGTDATEGLRKAGLWRQLAMKILFTADYLGEAIRSGGGPGRSIPLLSKPYRLQELAEHLRSILAG